MSGLGDTASGTGADKAVAELGRAITRAAEALRAIPGDDDATAYSCARVLDAALGDLADLLRTVPGMVDLGDPGTVIKERLERSRGELSSLRDKLAEYRAALDDLAGTEQHLAEITEESSLLSERVAELERAQRMASEIPGLRVRAQALDEAIAALGAADAPEISSRLADAVGRLAQLTERERQAMSAEAAAMVAAAETAARELDEQRARRDAAAGDLAKYESDTAQLAAEHSEMLPVLIAWSKADLDLAEGLRAAGFATDGAVLDSVRSELAGIKQRLTDLDEALGPLLAAQAQAYEEARKVRPY